MDKKTTRFNIVHGDNEYEIPEECEAAEEAAEELAKTNLEEHYSFINLLSIAVIMLFACIFFISVSGSDIVEDNNLSSFQGITLRLWRTLIIIVYLFLTP